jgi:hypothetical protein
VIQKAVKYIENCTTPEGGVQYSIRGGGARPAITAAAVACLFNSGEYDNDYVKKLLDYCEKNVWPGQLRDERIVQFQLIPKQVIPREELLSRAENLRQGSREGYVAPLPAGRPVEPARPTPRHHGPGHRCINPPDLPASAPKLTLRIGDKVASTPAARSD